MNGVDDFIDEALDRIMELVGEFDSDSEDDRQHVLEFLTWIADRMTARHEAVN